MSFRLVCLLFAFCWNVYAELAPPTPASKPLSVPTQAVNLRTAPLQTTAGHCAACGHILIVPVPRDFDRRMALPLRDTGRYTMQILPAMPACPEDVRPPLKGR